jgi:predicted nucleic acid-binding protein
VTVVVDSSALVAYCLKEKQHHIERISEILGNGAISTDIIVTESANAILIANRRGLVDTETAKKALESALELIEINLRIVPQVELIKGAFDLARESKLTVYDALFIFLAKKTDSYLLSVDGDQTKIASKMGVNLIEL